MLNITQQKIQSQIYLSIYICMQVGTHFITIECTGAAAFLLAHQRHMQYCNSTIEILKGTHLITLSTSPVTELCSVGLISFNYKINKNSSNARQTIQRRTQYHTGIRPDKDRLLCSTHTCNHDVRILENKCDT